VTPTGRQIQLLTSEGPMITVMPCLSLMSKFILNFSFLSFTQLHDNFALTCKYNISV
jgi:hypothetical protein